MIFWNMKKQKKVLCAENDRTKLITDSLTFSESFLIAVHGMQLIIYC